MSHNTNRGARRFAVRAATVVALAVGVLVAAAAAASAVNSIKADGVPVPEVNSVFVHSDVNSI